MLSTISAEDLVTNDELNDEVNAENEPPASIPYPKHIFFIIGNEFCERFCYFGMKGEHLIC